MPCGIVRSPRGIAASAEASRQCHSTCECCCHRLRDWENTVASPDAIFPTDCANLPPAALSQRWTGLLPVHFLFCERETEKRNRGKRDMAIYHLEAKVVSRGAGRSAVAACGLSELFPDATTSMTGYSMTTRKNRAMSGRRFFCRSMPRRNGKIGSSYGTLWRKSRQPRTAGWRGNLSLPCP